MTNKTQEQVGREGIEQAAGRFSVFSQLRMNYSYIGLVVGGYFPGFNLQDYLRAYGLTFDEEYSLFIESLAQHGYPKKEYPGEKFSKYSNLCLIAKKLGVSMKSLDLKARKPKEMTLERTLENNDYVCLRGFSDSALVQDGRFVLGANPESKKWALIAEKNPSSHARLFDDDLSGFQRFEGGFIHASLYAKYLSLYGASEGTATNTGELSAILLRRAFPNFNINTPTESGF